MNPAFMLDTDTVSLAMRGEGHLAARIVRHRSSNLCISAITLAELRYGAVYRGSEKLHQKIDILTKDVAVAPFDEACAVQFGRIAGALAKQGRPIGHMDAMIAAHALVLDVTLVTANVRHFERVQGLKVENWA
jgi:tRNA(fMet)-specific endonuclease VapC